MLNPDEPMIPSFNRSKLRSKAKDPNNAGMAKIMVIAANIRLGFIRKIIAHFLLSREYTTHKNGWVCVSSLVFYFGAKNFAEAKPREAGRANEEAAAAIPFPLKPLFLAAAADTMICYRFLIK